MKIRSRKTGLVHEVSKEQWAGMQQRFDSRHYDVIDDSDDDLGSVVVEMDEIKPMAFDEMVDDSDDLAVANGSRTFTDDDEEIAWLKDKLDEAEIDYHPRTGIIKLRKLYEQI